MNRRFFTCSAGKPGEGYDDDNIETMVRERGFVFHEDTPEKTVYNTISPSDILILKYKHKLVAYGEARDRQLTADQGWNHWVYVSDWHFFNPDNYEEGVDKYGVQDATLKGGQHATIKEVNQEWGLKKIAEIDDRTALILHVKREFLFNHIDVEMEKLINLLRFKKQIILQGPPGTGKTKLAKELANELAGTSVISDEIILNHVKLGGKIKTAYDRLPYEIKEIADGNIKIVNSEKGISQSSFEKVKDAFAKKVWLGDRIKSESDSGSAAVAKFIYEELAKNQTEIIQFHPSYSYEDFVRGIVSKPNEDGDGILYEAENKLLGDFALTAYKNYVASQQLPQPNRNIPDIDLFQDFIADITGKIANSEAQKFLITDAVYLFSPDKKRFKYKGDNWVAHKNGLNMKFSELEKILASGATERSVIDKLPELESLTRDHSSYYTKVINLFYEYKKTHPATGVAAIQAPVQLNNYVLIIDEINRANLSAVLGELIYALEYRGEKVRSMYNVDGDDGAIILPPNLYIIGTMNTADRSVGHIDYAIRRRFAFVDVLPRDLSQELGDKFHQELYNKVQALFDDHISPEFDKKDVRLGHSYFIDKSNEGGSIAIRLEYEIKPILKEYIKDGILKEAALSIVNEL